MQLKPSEIFYSQDSINNRIDKNCSHAGRLIGDTLDDICEGRCSVYSIPTIRVVNRNGKWVTCDNRRLWVFRYLERLGKVDKVPVQIISDIPSKKLTSVNGGTQIAVRGNPGGYCNNQLSRFNDQSKPIAFEYGRNCDGPGSVLSVSNRATFSQNSSHAPQHKVCQAFHYSGFNNIAQMSPQPWNSMKMYGNNRKEFGFRTSENNVTQRSENVNVADSYAKQILDRSKEIIDTPSHRKSSGFNKRLGPARKTYFKSTASGEKLRIRHYGSNESLISITSVEDFSDDSSIDRSGQASDIDDEDTSSDALLEEYPLRKWRTANNLLTMAVEMCQPQITLGAGQLRIARQATDLSSTVRYSNSSSAISSSGSRDKTTTTPMTSVKPKEIRSGYTDAHLCANQTSTRKQQIRSSTIKPIYDSSEKQTVPNPTTHFKQSRKNMSSCTPPEDQSRIRKVYKKVIQSDLFPSHSTAVVNATRPDEGDNAIRHINTVSCSPRRTKQAPVDHQARGIPAYNAPVEIGGSVGNTRKGLRRLKLVDLRKCALGLADEDYW